jgi:hypothetical protein
MVPPEISSTLNSVIELVAFKWVHCSLSEFRTAAILQGQMSTSDHNFVKCHIIYLRYLCATTSSEREKQLLPLIISVYNMYIHIIHSVNIALIRLQVPTQFTTKISLKGQYIFASLSGDTSQKKCLIAAIKQKSSSINETYHLTQYSSVTSSLYFGRSYYESRIMTFKDISIELFNTLLIVDYLWTQSSALPSPTSRCTFQLI